MSITLDPHTATASCKGCARTEHYDLPPSTLLDRTEAERVAAEKVLNRCLQSFLAGLRSEGWSASLEGPCYCEPCRETRSQQSAVSLPRGVWGR